MCAVHGHAHSLLAGVSRQPRNSLPVLCHTDLSLCTLYKYSYLLTYFSIAEIFISGKYIKSSINQLHIARLWCNLLWWYGPATNGPFIAVWIFVEDIKNDAVAVSVVLELLSFVPCVVELINRKWELNRSLFICAMAVQEWLRWVFALKLWHFSLGMLLFSCKISM